MLKQLQHPAIPRHIEDFESGSGKRKSLNIVQELIEGRSLRDELADHRYNSAEVIAILRELAAILGHIHTLSPPIVHRDIKPSNVIRRAADGRLVLIDFGSVRDVLKDPRLGGSTITGTFGYMAPEQFRGEASPATDFYGLGALAVELLSRRDPSQLLEHGRLRWESAVNVEPALAETLRRLLEPDPHRRISSSAELDRALADRPLPVAFVPKVAARARPPAPWTDGASRAALPSIAESDERKG